MDGCRAAKSILFIPGFILYVCIFPADTSARQDNNLLTESLGAIDQEIILSPTDYNKRINKLDLLLKMQRWDEASAEMAVVSRLRRNTSELNKRRALLNIGLLKFQEAKEILMREHEQGLLAEQEELILIDLLLKMKDFRPAFQLANQANGKYLPNPQIYKLIARAAGGLEKQNEAELAYRKALQLDPKDADLWVEYAGHLITFQKNTEAVSALKNGIYLNNNSNEFLTKAVAAAEKINEDILAIEIYRAILQNEPDNDFALLGLAKIYEKNGNLDQMGALLASIVNKNPEKIWAVLSYANLLHSLDQKDTASKVLSASILANPNNEKLVYFRDTMMEKKNAVIVVHEPQEKNPKAKPARAISSEPKDESLNPPAIKMPPQTNINQASDLNDLYTVRAGDIYGTISQKVFGTSKKWQSIFEMNKNQVKNPKDLMPGMIIKIPRESASAQVEDEARFLVSDIFSTRAAAAEKKKVKTESSLLVDPNSIELPKVRPQEAIPATAGEVNAPAETQELKQIEAQKKNLLWNQHFSFFVLASAVSEKHKLTGSGFNANLPFKTGYGYGLGAAYRIPQIFSEFSAKAYATKTSLDNLSGVSPSSIDINKKSLSLSWKNYFLYSSSQRGDYFEKIWFKLGYLMKWREVTETAPRPVITELENKGLEFSLGIDREVRLFGKDLVWENSILAFFPSAYKETKTNTGFLNSASHLGLQSSIAHPISQKLSLAYGISVQKESAIFSGTGGRGVSDGKENNTIIQIPVELRF